MKSPVPKAFFVPTLCSCPKTPLPVAGFLSPVRLEHWLTALVKANTLAPADCSKFCPPLCSTSSYLIFLFRKGCLTFSDTMHVEEITIDGEGTEVLQSPEPKNQKLETDTLKESSNSILMK